MSPSTKTAAALVAAMATAAVLGHGHVTGVVADGVYYGGFSLDYYYENQNTGTFTESVGWWAEDIDNGFVSPDAYNSSNIICHLNGQPANKTATVAAGGSLEFQWTDWGHIGVVLTYAAACPAECTDPALDKTVLEWVKVDEGGFDVASQTWATADLEANNMSWTMTVPSDLATGNYVFRHEIIALHGASSLNGAQNYPQCLNIQVTGGGSASPAGTLGEALYSETDPGIYFNPYATLSNYTIPGPALMSGATEQTVTATFAGSAATSTSVAAAAAPTTSSLSSVVAAAAAATAAASSSSSVETAAAVTTATSSSAAAAETDGASSCSKKRRRHARDVVM